MTQEAKEYEHPQGLRPGMRHSGQFKAGNDVRRFARYLSNGRTLASIARDHTETAVNVLVQVATGVMPDVKPSDRVRAAELLLDRGHGKATQVVQLDASQATIVKLTTEQLERIAAGALPAIEGESTVVTGSITGECSDAAL